VIAMTDVTIKIIHHGDSTRIQQATDLYKSKSVGKLHLGQFPVLEVHARENVLFGATNDDGELRGVLLAGAVDIQTRKDYEGYVSPSVLTPRTIEILDTAVLPAYRRQGVGTALVQAAIELYEKNGFHRFLTASRFGGCGSDSSFGLLLRLGFEVLREVQEYYRGSSFQCPDCEGTCLCSGYLMLREE